MALTYSITGGADAAKFNINATSGALTFKTAPDYEQPGDADHNNIYQVEVGVSDGTSTTKQMLNITVSNVADENLPPQFTSPAAFTVPENQTTVATLTATDPDAGGGTQPPQTGWPGAGNTGVPAGTVLTNAGGITTTQNGQIIQAVNAGIIDVRHPGVTIKKSKAVRIFAWHGDSTGLIVEDCEITGASGDPSGLSLGVCHNAIVRRCNIHHVENSMWISANGLTIKDNWMHHPQAPNNPDPHYDGLQLDAPSDLLVEHNNFDFGQGGQSSSITSKDIHNVMIRNNRIDGGSYCVYIEGASSGVTLTLNAFITNTYGWVAGTSADGQTYTQNSFAGGPPVDGVPAGKTSDAAKKAKVKKPKERYRG